MTFAHHVRAALRGAPILLLIWLATPQHAFAQQLRSIVVRWDNDILAVRGTGAPPDYDYTQGLLVTAELRGVLRHWLERERLSAGRNRDATLRLGIGQRIYTPRQDASEPVPCERPYAGWLYSVANLAVFRSGVEHHLEVELGMTGPAALGEQIQNGIHQLVGATRQEGWDHQLLFEPAVVVRYGAAWPREVRRMRLRPHAEVGAGTLWTGAAGGADVGIGARPEERGLFAEAAVRQEWVIRNLFLDGNTFRESVRADKRGWVSEAAVGFGYRFGRWSLAYAFNMRSREYRAQPSPHGYGSIAVRWHPQ